MYLRLEVRSMDSKEREEVFKAINELSNKVNDFESRLNDFILKLDNDTNESLVSYTSDLLYQVCLLQLGTSDDDVSINK